MAEYETQYTTTGVNTSGRKGKSYIEGGSFAVNLVPPGSKREGTNPEELFALGYSACFHSALEGVKKQEQVDKESIVRHKVSIEQNKENSDTILGVVIEVGIEDLDQDRTKELAVQANELCPYSRAIKNGEINFEVKAVPYEEG